MAKSDRPLSVEERAQIVAGLERAMQWAGIGRTPPTPAQLHELVSQAVDGFREQDPSEREQQLECAAKGLGALWGQVLCDQFGWTWVMMQVDKTDEGFGVVPSIRTHVIYPFRYLNRLLATPAQEHAIDRVYNAIKTNKLPKSLPRGYMVVSGGRTTALF